MNEKEAECHNFEAKISDLVAQLAEARNSQQEIVFRKTLGTRLTS